MADVTWFKVLNDIFADDKIKIIQSMPEGDALLIMWFKVLAQASKNNDGGYIYLKKHIPYTAGMLSTLFGKQQQIVELALRTFVEFGMIDMDERGYIFVTHWEKHQSIDKLNKIKEQDKLRAREYRERKKLELAEKSEEITNRHVTVTLPSRPNHATEIDIEKEKDKENKERKKTSRFAPPTLDEVISYISEKGLNVDGQHFYDYFTVGDWIDSKGNKVRNWKQKLQTWEKHSSGKSKVAQTGQAARMPVIDPVEEARKREEELNVYRREMGII